MSCSADMQAGKYLPLFDGEAYLNLLREFYPRILSQIDRDPDSPTYGSCDRHFWMYRLHDFDSGVLQQISLGLAVLSTLPGGAGEKVGIDAASIAYCAELARAINRRTASLLTASGHLDEYYPGENSLPGTVFAAYALVKSAVLLGQQEVFSHPGTLAAAEAALGRAPSPAANQDTGAAAFLWLMAKHSGWKREAVTSLVERLTCDAQGRVRFAEYGGADLGYATVTLHYLAMMVEDGYEPAGRRLVELAELLSEFVAPSGRLGGEFTSRSTTYFLPSGLIAAARLQPGIAGHLGALDPKVVAAKLDDRYLSHYCFPAFAIAAKILAETPVATDPSMHVDRAAPKVVDRRDVGLMAVRWSDTVLLIGLDKGGAFQIEGASTSIVDCGYRVKTNDLVYATCVLDSSATADVELDPDHLTIRLSSAFLRYGSLVHSPLKTIVLRLMKPLGSRLNAYFKRRLIRAAVAAPRRRLRRKISVQLAARRVSVEDRIEGASTGDTFKRAPAASFRLVPSAKFHQRGEEEAFLNAREVQHEHTMIRVFDV